MSASRPVERENRLFATLSASARKRLLASCERVTLGFAEIICESGEPIRHVYFPLDSFISLVTVLADGARLEVGMVGDEGMLGTSVMLGVDISPQHALVQGAGAALRLSTAEFQVQCSRSPALRLSVNRYIYVLMGQLAQTAACTHFHRIEARLARWLLMTRDRAHSNRFRLTHEFLAYILGVRRVGITKAAGSLQDLGLIHYSRGTIVIQNAAGLEKASCRCYQRDKDIYKRVMGN